MTLEERKQIISNEYLSGITQYKRNDLFIKVLENYPKNIIDEKYAVLYAPISIARPFEITEIGYSVIPKLYTLLDTVNLDNMGVGKVQNIPQLGLKGEGVLLGFVDTGIDYTNPVFKSIDGTTRIVSIWDQSIENMNAENNIFYYGTEYHRDQIDQALINENPFSIVPSKDENGHGTMLAGIAAGSRDEENDFQGVVPLSEIVVVKLKQAKSISRNFFLIPDGILCYQEDDIMLGIKYLMNVATSLNKPIVICLGLGTNQGGHDGTDILEDFIEYSGTQLGTGFIIAAGNEGNSKSHYYGIVDKTLGYNEVELFIGDKEQGFSIELWGFAPSTYSIDILSPSGQYVPVIKARLGEHREIKFLFENTIVYVYHLLVEAKTGDPLILIRFQNPAQGLWKFKVYARSGDNLNFHMWLPITGFISSDTYFVRPDPETTITSPGNSFKNTTVTAYNGVSNEIFINASRGFTRSNFIKPDVAAPGVNVLAPMPGNVYSRVSGSSVAAAHVSGISAMLFEWGIVRGNYMSMSSLQIQRFLIRGAETISNLEYPNKIWGYGKINIYNTFSSLSNS